MYKRAIKTKADSKLILRGGRLQKDLGSGPSLHSSHPQVASTPFSTLGCMKIEPCHPLSEQLAAMV